MLSNTASYVSSHQSVSPEPRTLSFLPVCSKYIADHHRTQNTSTCLMFYNLQGGGGGGGGGGKRTDYRNVYFYLRCIFVLMNVHTAILVIHIRNCFILLRFSFKISLDVCARVQYTCTCTKLSHMHVTSTLN